jgi:hypothetical protein
MSRRAATDEEMTELYARRQAGKLLCVICLRVSKRACTTCKRGLCVACQPYGTIKCDSCFGVICGDCLPTARHGKICSFDGCGARSCNACWNSLRRYNAARYMCSKCGSYYCFNHARITKSFQCEGCERGFCAGCDTGRDVSYGLGYCSKCPDPYARAVTPEREFSPDYDAYECMRDLLKL